MHRKRLFTSMFTQTPPRSEPLPANTRSLKVYSLGCSQGGAGLIQSGERGNVRHAGRAEDGF